MRKSSYLRRYKKLRLNLCNYPLVLQLRIHRVNPSPHKQKLQTYVDHNRHKMITNLSSSLKNKLKQKSIPIHIYYNSLRSKRSNKQPKIIQSFRYQISLSYPFKKYTDQFKNKISKKFSSKLQVRRLALHKKQYLHTVGELKRLPPLNKRIQKLKKR